MSADACPSRYTVNRRTGEVLTCERPAGHAHRHLASRYGTGWHWAHYEADEVPRG